MIIDKFIERDYKVSLLLLPAIAYAIAVMFNIGYYGSLRISTIFLNITPPKYVLAVVMTALAYLALEFFIILINKYAEMLDIDRKEEKYNKPVKFKINVILGIITVSLLGLSGIVYLLIHFSINQWVVYIFIWSICALITAVIVNTMIQIFSIIRYTFWKHIFKNKIKKPVSSVTLVNYLANTKKSYTAGRTVFLAMFATLIIFISLLAGTLKAFYNSYDIYSREGDLIDLIVDGDSQRLILKVYDVKHNIFLSGYEVVDIGHQVKLGGKYLVKYPTVK